MFAEHLAQGISVARCAKQLSLPTNSLDDDDARGTGGQSRLSVQKAAPTEPIGARYSAIQQESARSKHGAERFTRIVQAFTTQATGIGTCGQLGKMAKVRQKNGGPRPPENDRDTVAVLRYLIRRALSDSMRQRLRGRSGHECTVLRKLRPRLWRGRSCR